MSGRSSEQLVPDKYRRLMEQETSFRIALPQTYAFLEKKLDDFVGLSLLIGNHGGYLLVLKRYDGEGRPEVAFSYGDTALEALFAGEKALAKNTFKEDKPRVTPKKTP